MRTLLAFAITGAVALLVGVAATGATGTVDQSQTTSTGSYESPHQAQWSAQTFTAGASGRLDRVDLLMNRWGSDPGHLIVQIQTVSAGDPSGTVIGSGTFAGLSIGLSDSWITVPLTAPAAVTAGTQYAVVLAAPSAPLDAWVFWAESTLNPYSGGNTLISADSGATWTSFVFADTDTAFMTYVAPALPVSIDQCLGGGWATFGQFKNQGDCVSYVATKGRNAPSG